MFKNVHIIYLIGNKIIGIETSKESNLQEQYTTNMVTIIESL